MHPWEGLLVMESRRGIFFSSDLMMRFGEANGTIVESNWQAEINIIARKKCPILSGFFFSSDLIMRLGEGNGTIVESNWQAEINIFARNKCPILSVFYYCNRH